jgi:PDZ domain-containing protein
MTFVASLILSLALQDQDRIQDLIRKLGSDDFTTREQATEELKKAGKTAREALKKAADESEDPEVRQRARTLLDDLAKAEKPQPRRVPAPGFQGFSGVTVRTVNGDSTYQITPGDGSPVLTFHKAQSGQVKLDYVDGSGESKTAQSVNLQTFLKDHKELAQKYGITEEGIEYGGSKVSFKGPMFPRGNAPLFPLPQRPNRVPPPQPLPVPPDDEEEGTPIAGALLGPVEDSLRAQLDIPEGQGAVVLKVLPGGLAASLGLKKNDVLLEIDGKKITSPESAKGRITKDSGAVVLRKGKKETLGAKKDF